MKRLLGMLGIGLGLAGAGGSVAQPVRGQEAHELVEKQNAFLLDVRTPEEFAAGHVPGAVNIPVQVLATRMNEVPKNRPVVVYCRSGVRSANAAKMLSDAGYTKLYDLGGMSNW